jgi:hypothetical protein
MVGRDFSEGRVPRPLPRQLAFGRACEGAGCRPSPADRPTKTRRRHGPSGGPTGRRRQARRLPRSVLQTSRRNMPPQPRRSVGRNSVISGSARLRAADHNNLLRGEWLVPPGPPGLCVAYRAQCRLPKMHYSARAGRTKPARCRGSARTGPRVGREVSPPEQCGSSRTRKQRQR